MSYGARPLGLLLAAMLMSGCWGGAKHTLGMQGGTLAPCPSSPNCVHTGLRHPDGMEGMFADARVPLDELMERIAGVVSEMPRTKVMTQNSAYLHAEVTSLILRFVDDLEIGIGDGNEVLVRSSSRVGRSDLGVNRARVEELRARLKAAGLVR